jgi:TolB-like protein/Flp pilus assembly protein TadD
MVSGRPPFSGTTTADIIASILTRDPPPLREVAPDAPEELARVVDRALRKEREERYPSIQELSRDLESGGGREEPHRPSGVSRRRLAALALSTAATCGLGLYLFSNAGSRIDSIAILPFENEAGSAELNHLADGIPEGLINRFTGVADLRVLPRSTVFLHRGETDPIGLARRLGVDAILSGRVSEGLDGVTLQVDLIDVAREAQLWGERYSSVERNLPEVEEDIAANVVERLRVALEDSERGRIAKRYTPDSEAYQLFLRGRHLVEKGDPDSQWKSIEYFTRATVRDPGFALAFAQIGYVYTYLDSLGAISGNEAGPKAREYVGRALAIDDELAEAHAHLGEVKYVYDWDWPGAEREFRRALALNPASAMAHRAYAVYLVCVKRFEEAISEMKRALELEPLSSLLNHEMTAVLYFSRRFDEAIQQGLTAVELDRGKALPYWYLSKAYIQRGRLSEAFAAQVDGFFGGTPEAAKAYRQAYQSFGWAGYLRKRLELLRGAEPEEYVSPYRVAELYVQLGETKDALEWLEKAIADRDDKLTFLAVEPNLDPLRSEPRFQEMLRTVRLLQ